MDNEAKSIIRSLELQNEAKTQDLSIANQRLAELEQQMKNLTGSDSSYNTPETQIEFIRKIANSSSKFAKEAQDIIATVENV